jgi:hypothetical protein
VPAPERIDQPIARYRPIGVHQQQRQQRDLPRPTDRQQMLTIG